MALAQKHPRFAKVSLSHLPPGLYNSPSLHWHSESAQLSPLASVLGHTFPQPPQFAASVAVSTHTQVAGSRSSPHSVITAGKHGVNL